MKWHLFLAIPLILLTLLAPLLTTFHDDGFYRYAYTKNGAYEQLGNDLVLTITENFQAFLHDQEPLRIFDHDQKAHLEDVKALYKIGTDIVLGLFIISYCVIAVLTVSRKQELLSKTLRTSGVGGVLFVVVISLFALNWGWFFNAFHELLFTSNWTFSDATLMIRMWGGNFFPLAALYAGGQTVIASALLWMIGTILRR